MAPTSSAQDQAARLLIYDECRAVQMRTGQSAPDLQLLADDEVIALTAQLQTIYSAGWAAGKRLDVANRAEIHAKTRFEEIGKFFGSVLDLPAVEIASFLVETREDARKKLRVTRIAISRWSLTDPGFGCVRAAL